MMNKTLFTTIALTALTTGIGAQQTQQGEAAYRYADATQLWHNIDLAAGLSVDSVSNRGLARFDLNHQSGDYARVQEGSQQNSLSFFTERYQTIGRYLYGYGRFEFDMGRTKNRAWSDVQRTYHSNPFIVGSNVKGSYDHQRFDFTAAVGTTPLIKGERTGDGLRLGAQLDYKVCDLSRLRDPRSRSQLLDYRLTPSATYTAGQHTIALSGYYNRRKEKIPNITTVQDDPNLMYYLMSGLEAAEGTTGGYKGFNREWVGHTFGAALAYNYKGEAFSTLTKLGISKGKEYVYETYKREPGQYNDWDYSLHSRNLLRQGRLLHRLDVETDYREGYADEYRQQLQIENDPQTGYTSYSYETLITFRKRYQTQQFHLKAHYRLNFTCQQAITGYVGLKADVSAIKDKHLLPESQLKLAATDGLLEGGKALLKNHRLWIDASAGYHHASRADLSLPDTSTDYAQQVLLPDTEYYRANYWKGNLSVTYQLPLTIKQSRTLWFVRAYGQYLKTNNILDSKSVGISFGIFN